MAKLPQFFHPPSGILRTQLAYVRTQLANVRTQLANVRTQLAYEEFSTAQWEIKLGMTDYCLAAIRSNV